jgi:MoxR-like ATPase
MEMNITTFRRAVLNNFPVTQSIIIQGASGVGKSQVVRQIADELKLPFEDVRLGQMTEGDLLGLFSISDGVTVNHPPAWLQRASQRPTVLCFEELNRAMTSVVQGVFQIVLERRLGDLALHPETRVFATVNIGTQYTVMDIDPALRNRFATVELVPEREEFYLYAEGKLNKLILDFLKDNPEHLEVDVRPTTRAFPTRRSWFALSAALDKDLQRRDYSMVYPIAGSLVGQAAASALKKYTEDQRRVLSSDEILLAYQRGLAKKISLEDQVNLMDSCVNYLESKDTITPREWENFGYFLQDCHTQVVVDFFRKLYATTNVKDYAVSINEEKHSIPVRQAFNTAFSTEEAFTQLSQNNKQASAAA